MDRHNIYIKNMVCNRCVMVVESVFRNAGIDPLEIKLGVVTLPSPLNEAVKASLGMQLEELGFSFIDDKRSRLVEQVKNAVIELIHHGEAELKTNLSDHLASRLGQDYAYISSTFSEIENTTVEKYFIAQKIEKAKELLAYDELSVKEISFRLNYSSPAHFSNQFKKVTGLTPNHFKRIGAVRRKPLDKV